jgi:peptidoglycan/xylan/chitin deacetylase (PgdA/CDA1 family)
LIDQRHDIREGVVALTFDDGPSDWTAQILQHLEDHEGHATFFALGCLAADYEPRSTLRKVVDSGSEVANHTYSHPSLPTIEGTQIHHEFERARTAIEAATGITLRYWQPPSSRR